MRYLSLIVLLATLNTAYGIEEESLTVSTAFDYYRCMEKLEGYPSSAVSLGDSTTAYLVSWSEVPVSGKTDEGFLILTNENVHCYHQDFDLENGEVFQFHYEENAPAFLFSIKGDGKAFQVTKTEKTASEAKKLLANPCLKESESFLLSKIKTLIQEMNLGKGVSSEPEQTLAQLTALSVCRERIQDRQIQDLALAQAASLYPGEQVRAIAGEKDQKKEKSE